MSAEPGPQDPEAGDRTDADGDDEELESVELEEREDDDVAYARFDCTDGVDADLLAEAVDAAQRAVEDGECIVLPTDTVYGIGADAFSADAVQGLLDAKGRGRDMPPPVLLGDASLIRALAADVPDQARELVDAHWPGPLTIVCRIQPSLRMDLGETDGTIALRVPDHALAREVLRRTGPLAVSSANRSGRPAALTCDEAVEQLGDRVEVYLDGGPVGGQALPSTIVDFTRRDDGQLLRRGALSLETLRRGPAGPGRPRRAPSRSRSEPVATGEDPDSEDPAPDDPAPADPAPETPTVRPGTPSPRPRRSRTNRASSPSRTAPSAGVPARPARRRRGDLPRQRVLPPAGLPRRGAGPRAGPGRAHDRDALLRRHRDAGRRGGRAAAVVAAAVPGQPGDRPAGLARGARRGRGHRRRRRAGRRVRAARAGQVRRAGAGRRGGRGARGEGPLDPDAGRALVCSTRSPRS